VIGKTSDDGHSLLHLGIFEWEPDVFKFLGDNVKRWFNELLSMREIRNTSIEDLALKAIPVSDLRAEKAIPSA
jgi:hypothetical protein